MRVPPVWLAIAVVVTGCIEAPRGPSRSKTTPRPEAEAKSSAPAAADKAPHFEPAPATGNVDLVVRDANSTARKQGETLVVYVGAEWCEPCKYFHRAVEDGQLDASLPGVRFLEFDADRDGERLANAGYDGRLIPRFALPGEDGRFGGTKIEGGIKGDGAVEHIMRRLGPMLASAAR